ncbi:MAG: tripartite tricarboxylate transporter substrate binding protein [Pseudomonadota bacterium]
MSFRSNRRLVSTLFSAWALGAGALALAQSYPTRPVRVVVPNAAGGAFDTITRAFAPQLSAALGQPIVPDNRPAAGGVAGVEYVAKAVPDGYTLLTAGVSQMVLNKHFYAKLPYDPERDFAPIGMIGDLVFALFVHTSMPANNLQELIAYAKANPGKLNYGSAGVGQSFHLAMELLQQRTGAQMTHVPYKGTAPANQDLIAGRIQVMFSPPNAQMLSYVRDGRLRALASVSRKRLPALPEVPTFDEAGIRNLDVAGWSAMFSPAGTPKDVVARLNRELVRVLNLPELAKAYDALSMLPASSTPEQLAEKVSREIAMWGPVVKTLGIQLE